MPERMPKDIEEMLGRIDDPEEISRLQKKWLEYAHANDNYERNYPQQFGNLVEANLKFKENKTIPTPAEQLAGYKEALREEVDDILYEQEGRAKGEQVYASDNHKKDSLTSSKQEALAKSGNDLDQSQNIALTWIQEYRDEQALQPKEQAKEEKERDDNTSDKPNDKLQEFRLEFGYDEIANDEREQDREEWDRDYEEE